MRQLGVDRLEHRVEPADVGVGCSHHILCVGDVETRVTWRAEWLLCKNPRTFRERLYAMIWRWNLLLSLTEHWVVGWCDADIQESIIYQFHNICISSELGDRSVISRWMWKSEIYRYLAVCVHTHAHRRCSPRRGSWGGCGGHSRHAHCWRTHTHVENQSIRISWLLALRKDPKCFASKLENIAG